MPDRTLSHPVVTMGGMNDIDRPQQLTLLPSPEVPVRFRLDTDTRRRGMAHIAEIRQQLADREAARANVTALPVRRPVRSTAA